MSAAAAQAVNPQVLAAIDALQTAYVRALDTKDLPAWLACFAPDGSYVCRSRENEERDLPIALMLDDTHARLEDRVKTIEEVWRGTFEDYGTRHFVQRLDCRPAGDAYAVVSNVLVAYTPEDGPSALLVTGTYEDAVVVGPGGARFRTKKAILDTVVTPRYLVYPI